MNLRNKNPIFSSLARKIIFFITLVLSSDQNEGASLRPYTALCTPQAKLDGSRPSLYRIVGGLKMTMQPGDRSAFRNAAVTSKDAKTFLLAEQPQERRNLSIQASRSVVAVFHRSRLFGFHMPQI